MTPLPSSGIMQIRQFVNKVRAVAKELAAALHVVSSILAQERIFLWPTTVYVCDFSVCKRTNGTGIIPRMGGAAN